MSKRNPTFAVVRKDISKNDLIPASKGEIPDKYRNETFLVISQSEIDCEYNLKIKCGRNTFQVASIDFAFFNTRLEAYNYNNKETNKDGKNET